MVCLFLGVAARGGESPAPVLLVVGDSLSAAYKIPVASGWVHLLSERLTRHGYNYHVVNASIPGNTTADGLSRLPSELKRNRPVIVIIALGGNDGLQGLPLKQMQDNLSHMIELSRHAGARVLLVGVRMPPNYGVIYTQRFAAVYKTLAQKTGVKLVPEILAGVATHPELMQAGGLHPLPSGEPRVLDNVWNGLKPLLKRSNKPVHSKTGANSFLRVP
ncbi:MAG: arylesterase [Gammaproteobacteria bacterium]